MSNGKKMGKRLQTILFFLITVIIGIMAVSYLYSGPNLMYDDSTYLYLAHYALEGNMSFLADRFAYGFLKIFQTGLPIYLFGYGTPQAYAATLMDYLIILLIIFLFARRVSKGNDWFALLVSSIGATFPFVAGNATRVLPDIPIGMVAALALYIFLVVSRQKHKILPPLLFGFLTFLTVYMNEEGYIFTMAVTASLLFLFLSENRKNKGIWRNESLQWLNFQYLVLFVIGGVMSFILYISVFYFAIHSPFFPFTHYSTIPNSFSLADHLSMLLPFSTLPYYTDTYPLGPFFLFSLFGCILAIYRNERKLILPASVEILVTIYFFIGPSSPSDLFSGRAYLAMPTVPRMFALLVLPAALLAGYFILSIFHYAKKKFGKKYAVVAILAILAISAVGYYNIYVVLHSYNAFVSLQYSVFNTLVSVVTNTYPAGAHIYAAGLTAQATLFMFNILTNFKSNYSYLDISSPSLFNLNYVPGPCADPGNDSILLMWNPANNTNTGGWLVGGNCTISLIGNFSTGIRHISRNSYFPAQVLYLYRVSSNNTVKNK